MLLWGYTPRDMACCEAYDVYIRIVLYVYAHTAYATHIPTYESISIHAAMLAICVVTCQYTQDDQITSAVTRADQLNTTIKTFNHSTVDDQVCTCRG